MKYLVIVIVSFFYAKANAQGLNNPGYDEANVIKKTGDTLHYLIERAISYTDYVKCKLNKDGEVYSIQVKDIKAIIFPYKYLECIRINKKEMLLTLLVKGKIELYNYIEIKTGETRAYAAGRLTPFSLITHYILRTGNEYKEIETKKFKNMLLQLLSDCQTMITKLNADAYSFEDMPTIIKEYNDCQ